MDKWKQARIVGEKMLSREQHPVPLDDLEEPWRTLYDGVQPIEDYGEAEAILWQAASGLPDADELVRDVLVAMPDCLPGFIPLSRMGGRLSSVAWLWPGWIPRGLVTLLGGAPGVGKSLVALYLARCVLHGEPFPDGALPSTRAPEAGPPRVVYADAEGAPQVLKQRAEAWHLDGDHLYPLLPPSSYGFLNLGDRYVQQRLLRALEELQPELLVVDSLSAIYPGAENSVAAARRLLGFLGMLAGQHQLALLLVHHLRKRGARARPARPVRADDLRGSSHIVARASSVLALSVVPAGPQPGPNDARRLEVVKTNLGQAPPPLGLFFEPVGALHLPGCGAPVPKAPILRFGEVPQPYRKPTQVDACAEWLLALLGDADGPLAAREVRALADGAGFSRAALYRARTSLEGIVVDTEPKRSPRNRWMLGEER